MVSLFLGAGFSRWAAGLPVAANLFDFELVPRNLRDEHRLREMAKVYRGWKEANAHGHPEEFIHEAMVNARSRKLVLWYITRRLSEPFIAKMLGGTQSLMIDDKRAQGLEGVVRARSFLNTIPLFELSGILTSNYDLLIEYGLGSSGFNYGTLGQILEGRGKNPWFPWHFTPVRLSGRVRLAKLHGSISWDGETCYTDGRCGVRGDALIVAPVPEKSAPENLLDVWKLASEIVRVSSVLVVFGFAFNGYDQALLRLLQVAGRNLRTVKLIDISPKPASARQLWPHALIEEVSPNDIIPDQQSLAF